jgi:hypothetical protein
MVCKVRDKKGRYDTAPAETAAIIELKDFSFQLGFSNGVRNFT